MKFYFSPRWSNELLDCSMPMTFDTYNKCSYNCQYCFSYFQKAHDNSGKNRALYKTYVTSKPLEWVNPDVIKDTFDLTKPSQFSDFIRQKIVMQWGGLADQFDEHERKHGVTLQLMQYFHRIDYPELDPPEWKKFSARRIFRGVEYTITVGRTEKNNRARLVVDGHPVERNVIPFPPAGTTQVTVEVALE